jgi:hypothetical protein
VSLREARCKRYFSARIGNDETAGVQEVTNSSAWPIAWRNVASATL